MLFVRWRCLRALWVIGCDAPGATVAVGRLLRRKGNSGLSRTCRLHALIVSSRPVMRNRARAATLWSQSPALARQLLKRRPSMTLSMAGRKRFQVSACTAPPAKREPVIPRAAAIRQGPVWSRPPQAVASYIGCGDRWLIGVDIETHHFETSRGNKGSIGQFGSLGMSR